MAELLNQEPKAREPFKVGEKPTIKVKAKRAVLLGHDDDNSDPIRVEKDDIGFVTEKEYKRHAHILDKLGLFAILLAQLGLLLGGNASAQTYSANQAGITNTNYFWFSTNITTQTGYISGGAMATNSIAAATTNTAVLLTPVGLTRYDEFAIQVTWTNATAGITNTLYVEPCLDGQNVDTNLAHALMQTNMISSGSNGIFIVNLPRSTLGAIGYIQFGVANVTGANVNTNFLIQVFVKPQHSG